MIYGALYKCPDCGEVFEHPKRIQHTDEPDEYVCPVCGGCDWEQAGECLICKELHPTKELEYGICHDCIKRAAKEHAAEYVMHDAEVTDSFAWWLHCREGVIV